MIFDILKAVENKVNNNREVIVSRVLDYFSDKGRPKEEVTHTNIGIRWDLVSKYYDIDIVSDDHYHPFNLNEQIFKILENIASFVDKSEEIYCDNSFIFTKKMSDVILILDSIIWRLDTVCHKKTSVDLFDSCEYKMSEYAKYIWDFIKEKKCDSLFYM